MLPQKFYPKVPGKYMHVVSMTDPGRTRYFAPVPFSAHSKSIDGCITPAHAQRVTTAVIDVWIDATGGMRRWERQDASRLSFPGPRDFAVRRGAPPVRYRPLGAR